MTATPSDESASGMPLGSVGLVARPAPGAVEVVSVEPSRGLKFAFSLSDARVAVIDIDVIMVFPDGGKLVLPGLALELVSGNITNVTFADGEVRAEKLVMALDDVTLSDARASVFLQSEDAETSPPSDASAKDPATDGSPAAASQTAPQETPQPEQPTQSQVQQASPPPEAPQSEAQSTTISSTITPTPVRGAGKGEGSGSGSGEDDTIQTNIPPPRIINGGSDESDSADNSSRRPDPPPVVVEVPPNWGTDLQVTMFGVDGQSSVLRGDGVTERRGSAAIAQANTDPDFDIQREAETLNGTGGADELFLDDPAMMPAGTAVRALDMEVTLPAGLTATQAFVSGLPSGMTVVGVTEQTAGYEVPLTGANRIQFILRYTLPPDGTPLDADGLFDHFPITVSFIANPGSGPVTFTGSVLFAIGDLAGAGSAVRDTGEDGERLYILDRYPPGNISDAGDGDDIVHAGAGHDELVGGDGADTLSYAYSHDGVRVNLSTGAGGGGYAAGDTFSGFESLRGSDHNDELTGDNGANALDGGVGADTLTGRGGDDVYVVDNVGDSVVEASGEGADLVRTTLSSYSLTANVENLTYTGSGTFTGTGNALDNVITGGANGNTLTGGAGADQLIGGAGYDTASYSGSSAGVTVDLGSGGVQSGGDAAGDVLTSIEGLVGSGHDDTLTGNAIANTISGGAGADTIDGGDDDDILNGDAGNDTIFGGDGADLISGGLGDDLLDGGTGNDVLNGGEGTNQLRGGAGADELDGGSDGLGHLLYDTSGSAVTINLYANAASGGDAAGDRYSNIYAVTGSSFGDTLTGNTSANKLIGGAGADWLDGGAGADTLIGGIGDDTFVVDNAGDVVTEASGEGSDTVRTSLGSLTLASNVESLVYTGASAFTGTGNELGNSITGGAANDKLSGGLGNDILDGGGGADTLIGGAHDDTYYVDNAGDVVTEATGEGTDTVFTSLTTYTLAANVENLVTTASGGVTYVGNTLDNVITGGAGNDSLDGNWGADTLVGGTGNDIYQVDDVGDVVVELAGGGSDSVRAWINTYTLPDHIEELRFNTHANNTGNGNSLANTILGRDGNDILYGHGDNDMLYGNGGVDTIYGGDGRDYIDGGSGNDLLYGGAGNDTLLGNTGADIMEGGTGDDLYHVDSLSDIVTEHASEGTDTVNASVGSYTLTANVENLTYTGVDAFIGTGNALANTITGGAGNDTLSGGGGADKLYGNGGNDSFKIDASSLSLSGVEISGGNGSDTVVFNVGGGDLSDPALLASLTSIETLDFTEAGVDATLSFSSARIAAITGSATSALTIKTNAGDSIGVSDSAANYNISTIGSISTYTIFSDAGKTTQLAQLIVHA